MTSCDLRFQGLQQRSSCRVSPAPIDRFRFRSQEQLYSLIKGRRGASCTRFSSQAVCFPGFSSAWRGRSSQARGGAAPGSSRGTRNRRLRTADAASPHVARWPRSVAECLWAVLLCVNAKVSPPSSSALGTLIWFVRCKASYRQVKLD